MATKKKTDDAHPSEQVTPRQASPASQDQEKTTNLESPPSPEQPNTSSNRNAGAYHETAPSNAKQEVDSDDVSSWTSIPQSELTRIWTEATSVGVVLPSHASLFHEIKTEPPRSFVVVFPGGKEMQRQYCETERTSIESRLSSLLGGNVALRLVIDPSIRESSREKESQTSRGSFSGNANSSRATPPKSSQSSVADYQELKRQVDDSKTAGEILDIFEAELRDIKPPAPVVKKKPRWGHADE